MRLCWWVLLVLGCGGSAPVKPRPAVAQLPTARVVTPSPEAPEPARPKRCTMPPPREVVGMPSSTEAGCLDHRAAETRLRPVFAKLYDPQVSGSSIEVRFGCDPVLYEPSDIVLETGYGHGGSLAIYRIHRAPETTGDFEVFGFIHTEPWETYEQYDYARADKFDAKIARGTIAPAVLFKALADARPALTVSFREVVKPLPAGTMYGFGMSTGSGNFHARLAVTDGLNSIDSRFTGYPGSPGQELYLGVEHAVGKLVPLVANMTLSDGPPSEPEQAWLVNHLLAAEKYFDDQFAWWVRGRSIRLAGRFGTPDLLPLVVREVKRGMDALAKIPTAERSDKSIHLLADGINAFARLGGFDPRTNADGTPRPAEQAAREIIEECR